MNLNSISRIEQAKKVLACLDLTELQDDSDQKSIQVLCRKALGYVDDSIKLEPTAAICIYSSWIEEAKKHLANPNIKIASVVNFPTGDQSLNEVINEINQIIDSGGDEIDCVFPYPAWLDNKADYCQEFLQAVRQTCKNKTLKIIMETSASGYSSLSQNNLLASACSLALINGADFLKTSTGKISGGATIDSIKVFIDVINNYQANNPNSDFISIKPSGGLKTLDDVLPYMQLLFDNWGEEAIAPNRFRIGASGIWNNLSSIILNQPIDQDNKQGY